MTDISISCHTIMLKKYFWPLFHTAIQKEDIEHWLYRGIQPPWNRENLHNIIMHRFHRLLIITKWDNNAGGFCHIYDDYQWLSVLCCGFKANALIRCAIYFLNPCRWPTQCPSCKMTHSVTQKSIISHEETIGARNLLWLKKVSRTVDQCDVQCFSASEKFLKGQLSVGRQQLNKTY